MTFDYVSLNSDGEVAEVLDTVTYVDGAFTYATSAAAGTVETIVRRCRGDIGRAVAVLRSWSNGYVATREHPTDV